jgi:hypothetical protein
MSVEPVGQRAAQHHGSADVGGQQRLLARRQVQALQPRPSQRSAGRDQRVQLVEALDLHGCPPRRVVCVDCGGRILG